MIEKTDKIYHQLQQELREKAEAQVEHSELIKFPITTPTPSEILHELRVHQIELEMQNEELQRAQLALEESRDRYVDLYEFAPVGYLTLTVDGAIADINLTGAALLGVERVKLINRRFVHYITPSDRDRWHHYFLTAKQQGCYRQSIDISLCRTNGTPLYAHIDCLHVQKDDNLPVLRITLTDITGRKQAEDALQESKARLAAIVEGAELATWDWNIQTGDIVFNERWAVMRGYALHEFEPHITFWEQGIFPDDLERVQNTFAEHFNNHTPLFNAEYRVRTKSGEWIWIMACGKVIQRDAEGKPLRITGITMNITQRKQIEERLRIAAVAFETQAGIIVTDANKHIICANQAFTCISGYTTQEVVGQTPFFLRSGLHNGSFYQKLSNSLKHDGCWQGEIWDKRKNGELFPVWLTMTAVRDNKDNITHYVGSFTDLTIQKQAEKVLLDARQQLENQVASTQDELERIKEDSLKINAALNVLLKHRETDKCDAQNALSREVKGTVLPFLKRLKGASTDRNQTRLITILETNLEQLVKFYGRDTSLSSVYQKLTPAEIQVASMVRQGLSTKLIATTLNLSAGTIGIHRKHIRKKLDLDSKEINLYSYLTSLVD